MNPRISGERTGRSEAWKARHPPVDPAQRLEVLLDLFPREAVHLEGSELVAAQFVPSPYRELLVHDHHMTVTLERHHHCSVVLQVRAVRRAGSRYARKLLLRAGPGGAVVMAGIVQLRLDQLTEPVRREILLARVPLGRILIEHRVLRRVRAEAFLRVSLRPGLGALFGVAGSRADTWGRLATIFCDDRPAIELLEIVAPEGRELSGAGEA